MIQDFNDYVLLLIKGHNGHNIVCCWTLMSIKFPQTFNKEILYYRISDRYL